MKYKVTLSIPEAEKNGYIKRNAWPLPINDHVFDESTVIETDDLMPFVANKKYPYRGIGKDRELRLDPRLKIEALNDLSDSEEAD